MALAPRGWAKDAHPPVLLFGVSVNDDGLIEAEGALVTHPLRAKKLYGTEYLDNGKSKRVRIRWTPNTDFGFTEELSTFEPF